MMIGMMIPMDDGWRNERGRKMVWMGGVAAFMVWDAQGEPMKSEENFSDTASSPLQRA